LSARVASLPISSSSDLSWWHGWILTCYAFSCSKGCQAACWSSHKQACKLHGVRLRVSGENNDDSDEELDGDLDTSNIYAARKVPWILDQTRNTLLKIHRNLKSRLNTPRRRKQSILVISRFKELIF
jgi:hypothetical protein